MVAKKTCFLMTIRVFIEASCEVANSTEWVYKGSEYGQFVKTEFGGDGFAYPYSGYIYIWRFLDRRPLEFFLLCYQMFVRWLRIKPTRPVVSFPTETLGQNAVRRRTPYPDGNNQLCERYVTNMF